MRLCPLHVLIGVFFLSVKASSVFRMTLLQRKVLFFFFFFAFFQTENVFCAMMFFNMYTAKMQLLEGETEAVGNVMLCQIKNYQLLLSLQSLQLELDLLRLAYTLTLVELMCPWSGVFQSNFRFMFFSQVCFKLLGLTSEKARDTASFVSSCAG